VISGYHGKIGAKGSSGMVTKKVLIFTIAGLLVQKYAVVELK
jgi:hypothetical protein